MKIKVELFGMARQIAHLSQVDFEINEGGDLRDLALAMAQAYPGLCGTIIDLEGGNLVPPYIFNINGKYSVHDLTTKLNAGDSVLVFSTMIGG